MNTMEIVAKYPKATDFSIVVVCGLLGYALGGLIVTFIVAL